LLEGLEISEVMSSSLEYSGRLDAEYYRPEHLDNEKLLRNRSEPLSALCDFIIGPFGSAFAVENYTDNKGYRYIRGKDVKPMRLCDDDNVYLPKADFERLSKYALAEDDVLVSVVGTIGNSALIEPQHLPAIFSCKSTALRGHGINPKYLISYLNCRYGRSLLLRKERGAVQKGLNLDDVKMLDVYVAGQVLQEEIARVLDLSAKARKQSKACVTESESVLLHSLGLENWQAPESLSYVRGSSEAFAAGRLDAEHFQESYYELRKKLQSHELGYCDVGELALSLTNGAEIREYQSDGTPYLRVGDIKNLTVDGSSVVKVDPALAEDEKKKVGLNVGDVLVSRSGSLAVTAVVEPEWVDALISSHLIRVRISDTKFDPYYVALFLSTLPGRMQIQQWSNGGVQPEISQPSLRQIIVPRLEITKQQEIRAGILAARKQRERATQLLEAAKRAVEIAIEDSEAAALAYLETLAS